MPYRADMEQRATSYQSQGLVRALRLLRHLGGLDDAATLSELSSALDIPKSTVLRLLAVLEDEGFVLRTGEPPRFRLGHAVLELADKSLRNADATELAAPVLRLLADRTGLTANLGVLAGHSVLHLRVEEPDRPLRFRSSSGSLDHTWCTGLGKMLLAGLAPELRAAHLPEEPYASFTPSTISTRSALDEELERIRERGHSIDDEERDRGVACVAMSVPNDVGAHVAISVAGPSGELDAEGRRAALPRLQDAAAELGENPRFLSALRAVRGVYPAGESA